MFNEEIGQTLMDVCFALARINVTLTGVMSGHGGKLIPYTFPKEFVRCHRFRFNIISKLES